MRTKCIFLAGFAAFCLGLMVPCSALAGKVAGDIDQWANTANSWQNGDLNPSNSHYREDFVVPYRAKLTSLTVGHSYTIPLEWDTTKGGLHAFDFLQTYNVTETAVDPCFGGVCPAGFPSTFPIPIDSRVNSAAGLHPTLNYSASNPDFQFTMWGGAITGTSAFTVSQGSFSSGAYSSDSSTMIFVTFTASSPSAVLAWGGHISTHSDWGVGNTAVNISGSPYHMRLGSAVNNNFHDNTDNTDSTLGNQDRSLKVGANAYSSRITVVNVGNPVDANTFFPFTLTQPQGSTCDTSFSLAANGSAKPCYRIFANGSFTFTETPTAPGNFKWGLTNIVCTSAGAPPVSVFTISPALPLNAPNPGSVRFSIDSTLQQDVTCTFTNKHKPTVLFTKVVHNGFGGTAEPGDFNFHVSGTTVVDLTGNNIYSNDILKSGTTVIMDSGASFTAAEDSHYGYEKESENGCTGTLAFSDTRTCTITNKDIQPQLTVIKQVINNNGGTAVPGDFTMVVSATNVSTASFAGSETGTTVRLNQGSFSVTEGASGYAAAYAGCSGQILVGERSVCTIVNDDIAPKLKIIKNAIGGNAEFPINISPYGIHTSITTTGGSGGNPFAQPPVPVTPGTGDTGYWDVLAGSVTIAEDLSGLQSFPAWRFTSVSCQEDGSTPTPISVAQNTSVTLSSLQLGRYYSCTFTNTLDAVMPLLKKVNGNAPSCNRDTHVCTDAVSGQTIPQFTISLFQQGAYPPSTPLNTLAGPPFQDLPVPGGGSFTICEMGLPAGWNLATGDVTALVTMFGGATGNINPTVSNKDTAAPASVNRCFDVTISPGASRFEITVNNKAEGKLKIVKQADGGDETFTFAISGGPTPFNNPVSLNTANSNPGVHQDATAEMPAWIGNYTITENNMPSGWALQDLTCTGPAGAIVSINKAAAQITAKVVPGTTTACTYKDSKFGHLIVTNVTDPASDTTTPFPITGSGTGNMTAPAARTLTGNGSSTDYEVAAGTYSVTETVPAGWDQTVNTCQNVIVPSGQTVNCQIINTKRAHLIVQKTTNPANDPAVFSINASGTGTVTGGGAGTVSDAADKNYEVTPGIYSITETVRAGWDQTGNACASVAMGAGETKTCEITNTKRGHLIVQKTTNPANDPAVFSINASGSGTITGGGAGTVTGAVDRDYEVTPGTYSVEETVPAGWDQTGNTCTSATVGAGETKTCEITNTKRGHLIVQKTTAPAGDPTVFSINASGSGTITGGGAGTVTDAVDKNYEMTLGTYSVVETLPAGWDQTGNTCTSVAVGAGETKTCQITNTKRGHLIVQKTTNPVNDPTIFSINALGSGTITGGAAGTVSDAADKDYEVTPATYLIAETVPAGWDQTGNTCASIVVRAGEIKTCQITNAKRGHLIVQKTTIPANDPAVFSINVTGSGTVTGGGAGTVADALDKNYEMTPGTYSVVETAPAGWDQTGNTCASVVVGGGETKTCQIINTKRAHLIVQKTTTPANDPAVFSINASGSGTVAGGGAGTMTDAVDKNYEMTPGIFSVVETVPAGWDQITNTCTSVVLGAGETKTCEITNRKRGHLIVQKTTSPAGDPAVFSINASGSGTITGSGPGTVTDKLDKNYEVTPGTYSVVETVPAGWDQIGNTCAGVELGAGETKTCQITNTKRAHLVVQKTTLPAADPTVFSINASGSGTITGGGAATVTDALDKNYEVTAGTYSVTEDLSGEEYWDLTGNTCTNVVLVAGETKTCQITNTKRGHLIVQKTTNPAGDLTVFSINASGTGTIIDGGAGTLTDALDKEYEVTYGTYSVVETVPADWAQTANTCVGVVVGPGEDKICRITNTKLGHVIVTKVTDPASDTSTLFPVTASGSGTAVAPAIRTLMGNGSSTEYQMTPGTYSVVETVPAGWDQTGNTCQNLVVGADQTVSCQITNTKRGHLIVHKATVPAGITTAQFSITASSSNGGTIANGATKTLAGGATADYEVKPGFAYSVAENVPSGWQLLDNTCLNVQVGSGQIVDCYITNGRLPVLTVTKFARFTDAPTKFSFNLTNGGTTGIDVQASTPYTNSDGSGMTGSATVYLANGASYTVEENLAGMADWFLNTVSCTSTGLGVSQPQNVNPLTAPVPFPRNAPPATSFSVGYGDVVTCAYTNTREATMGAYKLINGCDPSKGKGASQGTNNCSDFPPFTINLYAQDPVQQQDQGTPDPNAKWSVPLAQSGAFPAGYLRQLIVTPTQPGYPDLQGLVGVPFTLCEMNNPDGWGAYNWTVKITMFGSNTPQTIAYAPYLVGQTQPDANRLYNPDYFFSYPNDYNTRCINVMIPVGAEDFDVYVNNNVQLGGRMTGGGSVFTTATGAGQPSIGTRVTHGFELHCNKADLPNSLEINWDGGNKFHLEELTSSKCWDDPKIDSPAPPAAKFDTLNGRGYGRLNGVAGATAEWTFTDAGEPGVNDTVLLTIRDKNNSVVLQILAPAKLIKGNHQAHK